MGHAKRQKCMIKSQKKNNYRLIGSPDTGVSRQDFKITVNNVLKKIEEKIKKNN